MAEELKKSNPPAKAAPKGKDMPELEDDDEGIDAVDGFDEEEEDKPGKPPSARLHKKPGKAISKDEDDSPKLVKKGPKEAPIVNKVQPRKAFILGKNGKPEVDPETKEPKMYEPGYVRHVGYVNANGVLFPVGFRFKGGHVANSVEEYGIVLNLCPKCGHRQTVDEAVQGECGNMKVRGEGGSLGPCGYSAYEELDSYDLAE